MTRRCKNRLVCWTGLSMLCAVLMVGSTAWAEDADEAAPDDEGASVAEEVVDEAAQQAVEASERREEAPEGEEAQDSAEDEGVDDDAEAQQPAQQRAVPQEETEVRGGTLVIITYLILWLMLGAFLVVTLWRQGRLRSEVETLERRIDELLNRN